MMADTLDPLDPSPYRILNVPRDASLANIRSAHRKLVLLTHPDKVQDEAAKKIKAEQFHQVQQAYEILSDDNRRRRWDERSKLAELRAELAEERGPLRRAQTFAAPRTSQGPMFEMRGGRVYEERVPKFARAYEEDAFSAAFAAEVPRSARTYDERYEDTPARKTSGRGPDERRRFQEFDEDKYELKQREKRQKEEERYAHNFRQKQRDKTRRKDVEAKSSRKAYVEEDTSGSEDYDDRHYSSKSDSKPKRKDDERKRLREEPLRRSSKKDPRSMDPELDRKIYDVHDYLSKSRENNESDRRRPGRSRADSYTQRTELPSPPLTPHDRDYGRRSSGDDARRSSGRARVSRPPSPARKSSKNKTVDELPPRKPSLPSGGSERSGLKEKLPFSSKKEPQRSQTYAPESKPPRKPIMRAETMPTAQMRHEQDSRKHSTLRNEVKKSKTGFNDVSEGSSDTDTTSDSEDESVPPLKKVPPRPQPSHMRSYKVGMDESSPRIVSAEPEDYSQRPSRDVSPKSIRRSGDRFGGSTRTPLPRAGTFSERPLPRHSDSSKRMPPLKTSQSERDPRAKLFGELGDEDHSPKSQHGSPKVYSDDRFRSGYSRRGSEDIADRDAYPGSSFKGSRHRPHRSEVY